MAIERTLSIINPMQIAKTLSVRSTPALNPNNLKIVASKMKWLSRQEAEAFYAVHRERPFFKDLVDFMVSGPVQIQVLEGENAIMKNRELMGATDPKKAPRAPSEPISLSLSTLTLFTAPTAPKQLLLKSLSSSRRWTSTPAVNRPRL